ncbi:MAG: hypothetical protein IJU16_06010, partial [Clostridia bacterium]|nr:hypothetical protein [Clostridia bacterium]
MKTNKKSLLTAIAILAVCAMALTTSAYAWFSSVNTATLTNLGMSVTSASDLKIAIVDTATTTANIESASWASTFTGTQLAAAQSTFTTAAIADAYYRTTGTPSGFVKPATLANVAADGSYSGDFTAAGAPADYVKFTVYFRSTTANDVVKMSSNGISITSANSNLEPALTLRIDNAGTITNYYGDSAHRAISNQEVCTCSTAVVSSATG